MPQQPSDAQSAPKPRRNVNKATVRVFEVLSSFASGTASVGVTELSQRLGMTKNMTFRALNTLIEQGLLVRDRHGSKYELGYRALELQNLNFDDPDIRTLVRPFLEQCNALSGLTVAFQIPVGHNHVTIDGIEGRDAILTRIQWGVPVPLHASPGSRAILAHLTNAEIADYIEQNRPLKALTPHTITDPEKLWQEVELVRKRGYALSYGDHFADVRAAAFPVLDVDNRPHGAITMVAPADRLTQLELDALIPEVGKIVKHLNAISRSYHAAPIFIN